MNHNEFLNAVYARPDDHALRLQFADFLIEHGDPLGDFIRMQCLLRHSPQSAKRSEWRQQCQDLFDTHGDKWLADSPFAEQCRYDFRCGFIELATVPASCWLEHADEILRKTPLLTDLHLLNPQPYFDQLVLQGDFRQIESLRLTKSQLQGSQVVRLLECGRVGKLKELHLPFNEIGNNVMAVLSTSRVSELAMLDLRDNRLTLAGMLSLASSQHLGAMHTILLRGNRIGAEGFAAIMQSKTMPHLTTLNVAENSICGIEHFSPRLSGLLPRLKSLNLDENQLQPEGVAKLCQNGYFAGLQHLSLRCNGVGDAGAAEIAKNPLHGDLRTLNLHSNQITGDGIAELARSEHLKNLRQLDLSGNVFTFPGGKALLAPDAFPAMKKLTLSDNPLTRSAQEQLQNRYGNRFVYKPAAGDVS